MSIDQDGFAAAERLARALMFEGYVLYPYRRSSLKNVQRFSFGTLETRKRCARGTSEASALRVECLLRGEAPRLELSVRFLQRVRRDDPGEAEPWIEAVERACTHPGLDVASLARSGKTARFEHALRGERRVEAGSVRQSGDVEASIALKVQPLGTALFKLRIEVENTRKDGELLSALGSVHVLLRASGGRFVSALEPPEDFAEHAASCRSRGCFPVLVGPVEREDVMLASPIILYDRPAIAPESAGDFCDATEIDEMLTLRVLTLTDAERREAERTDPRCRAILERTYAQSEQALLALHGARREPSPLEPRGRACAARAFGPGDSVVLRPKRGGDVFDLALSGERATVASVEEDFEGRLHYAVTVDADPGRDLGAAGMPGHRFFFSAEELERMP
jgi:hydrogenase maturation protease